MCEMDLEEFAKPPIVPGDYGSNYFYGSFTDDHYMFKDPKSLPLYGPLARKALLHYLGGQYNPREVPAYVEEIIRDYIKSWVEYKIMYRTGGYDWQWIDHFLRKFIGNMRDLNLEYDQNIISAGFREPYRAKQEYDLDNLQ